ncbi:Uncharacterised protein [Mycobacteroides abscessus]|nr:Uncharacterised protein [Mycobacteroides abscessus]
MPSTSGTAHAPEAPSSVTVRTWRPRSSKTWTSRSGSPAAS